MELQSINEEGGQESEETYVNLSKDVDFFDENIYAAEFPSLVEEELECKKEGEESEDKKSYADVV